jgi:hypothetical protein
MAMFHPRDKFIQSLAVRALCGSRYKIAWDQHVYKPNRLSVTTLVKRNFPAFNADAIILKMRSNKKTWLKKKNYRGMTDTDIKAKWTASGDEARDSGTLLHKQIEDYYNSNGTTTPSTQSDEFKQFLEYADYVKSVKGWIPARAEWIVYTDQAHALCGTIDMVYIDSKKMAREPVGSGVLHLVIVDWKRVKAMKQWSQDKGSGVCSDVPNANFFHYSMQLQTYRHILENFYTPFTYNGQTINEIKVDSCWLVVFHPNKARYTQFKCARMGSIVTQLLNGTNNQ